MEILRWAFGRESRQTYDLLVADLKRDRKAMLGRGMPAWAIRLLLYCSAFRSLVPIAIRELAVLLALEELIRKNVGRK